MVDINQIIPKYTKEEFNSFDNESPFMDANVELLKQTIQLLWHILEKKYFDIDVPKIIEKESAVLAGNIVRLIKLNLSLLQNICDCKLEICYIVGRCLSETAINIKYMLSNTEESVIRNYIKYSLITEKEIFEIVSSNVRERSGEIESIEERMQKSIERSFESSDFDFEEVKRSSKWKTLRSRADVVAGDIFYNVYYGSASHSIHGNWQDILANNLEKKEGGFSVKVDWQTPRPQIMDGPIILNLQIIMQFVENELKEDDDAKVLTDKCNELLAYQSDLYAYHEKWLAN
jgi:hypothetical protein